MSQPPPSGLPSHAARWRYGGGALARFHLWLPQPGPLRLSVTWLDASGDRAVGESGQSGGLALCVFGPLLGGAGDPPAAAGGRLAPPPGAAWQWSCDAAAAGVWDVEVRPAGLAAAVPHDFAVRCEGAGRLFLLPEPGIVPSHFVAPAPVWSFLGPAAAPAPERPDVAHHGSGAAHPLPADAPLRLYFDVPDGLPSLILRALPFEPERTSLTDPAGATVPLASVPPATSTRVAEIEAPMPGWWRVDLLPRGPVGRVTTWQGLPLFWAPPPPLTRFPYVRLQPQALDEAGQPLDARHSLARGDAVFLVADVLTGETAELVAPPGRCMLTVSHGTEYAPHTTPLDLPGAGTGAGPAAAGDRGAAVAVAVQLRRAVPPAEGWLAGDCHMHSYYEDGLQSPVQVARASRTAGVDFAVLTDLDPRTAEAHGFTGHSVPGGFLGLPGQEVMTPDLHVGAINTSSAGVCPRPGADAAEWPQPAEILAAVRRQASRERPMTLVLNHPHDETERPGRRAYFRSWWVIDQHPDVAAVENFNWEAWVGRLNAGRRLAPLWTTDTHDVLLIQPGAKRTYVWTGGRRDAGSILDALVAGQSFHSQAPGAVLWMVVQGERPGSVVAPDADGGSFTVYQSISCLTGTGCSSYDAKQVIDGWPPMTVPQPRRRRPTAGAP